MSDALDLAAGLKPHDPVYRARRARPEFVEGAEICRASVLAPEHGLGLDGDLRHALALRMARLNEDEALVAQYSEALAHLDPLDPLVALGNGATGLEAPHAAIARHVDMVTLTPWQAGPEHIRALEAAGLSSPQIIALSELIAFVNFQTRVAAGLRLLRS
ncbi:esterase (plasmid) [Thioclava sp. 'Guangxiensis']|uniref:CMD domain-containing protein n=1 Tax=Thioclava sp. 'Guangxiensis' TaxID=3149044 RepID=UPI0032C49B42